MTDELISGGTRIAFREYFVCTTLAFIDDSFHAAGLHCDVDYVPPTGGQRRSLVEQYYHALDFTKWDDVKKLAVVYEHVLDDLEIRAQEGDCSAKRDFEKLLRALRRDRFEWHESRLLPPSDLVTIANVHAAVAGVDAPEINRQLGRLRESVNHDPALAIGTAKEMLETTCKTILEECLIEVDPNWDVGDLLKQTRKVLKLLPDDIPASAKGADTIKRLLSNLGQVGIGLSELRNLYGSGHGRMGKAKGLSPRHARLAVGAVSTLVLFLFETHEERNKLEP